MAVGGGQEVLGDDALALVLAKLPPAALAAAEATCRRWRDVAEAHALWRRHAEALRGGGGASLEQAGLPWKRQFLERKWTHVFSAPLGNLRTVAVDCAAHGGAAVTAVSAAPAGTLLASAAADGSLCLWELDPPAGPASTAAGGSAAPAPQLPRRPQLLCRAQQTEPVVWAQLLSPGLLASAGAATASMWRVSQDPPQLRLLRRWPVDGRVVCAAAWDQYLAAGCADGAVRIFDAFTGTCSKLLRPHQQGVAALQHVRRGEEDLLVSGGGDGRVLVIDAGSALELAEAQLVRGGVSCLLVDPASGRICAGAAASSTAHCAWLAGTGLGAVPSPVQRLHMSSNARLPRLLQAPHQGVAAATALAVPLYGAHRHYLAGCADGRLHICDAETWLARGFMLASQTQDSAALHAAPASQAGSSRSGGPNGTPAPPASTAPPLRGSRPAMSGLQKPRRCTCICASSMPMAAGFADGRLVIWDWREPEGAPVGGAQAAPHPN